MKSKKQAIILNDLIENIIQSEETQVEIEPVSGSNKHFGNEFKGSCILNGFPTHDRFSGLYYSYTVDKFFIHLTDRSSNKVVNYTKHITDNNFTPWLKLEMKKVAKSGKSSFFSFESILEGLKAEF